MTWTYTGNPSATEIDQVRFIVGQLSSEDPILLKDEEISWSLDQFGTWGGAVSCAHSLANQYAAKARREAVGQLAITWGNRAEEYREAAKAIRRQAGQSNTALPYLGGLLEADKKADRNNTAQVQPAFTRDRDDNPRIGTVDGLSTQTC